MIVYDKDKKLGVLQGGFQSFTTPKPETVKEWEKRKTKLHKTLWKLLGDIPPLFTPEVKIHKKQKKDGYTIERFTFDNGVGDTVYGYMLIPASHKGRGPAILYNHYHGNKYKQGKKEVITKAFTKLDFATGEELVRKGYIIQCIDATILKTSLLLTSQLLELKIPLVICLNNVDSAMQKGIWVDSTKLSQLLGVPVIETMATEGQGMAELRKNILTTKPPANGFKHRERIERDLKKLSGSLAGAT